MKQILIVFGIGLISYILGYQTCKLQLGMMMCQAMKNLNESKLIMVDAKDFLKRVKEDEIHDTTETDNKEE